jgi:peptidoglycan hydrolase-like protein with peptidoglycan-binding domain
MRKLILGAVSVLALGIGVAALDYVADADDAVPSAEGNMSSMAGVSPHWINTSNLSKDDVRWAQVELRNLGLYKDSLDGVMGPETRRALAAFQKANSLKQTEMLDQQTADALIGDTGIGQGSSVPPKAPGARPMTNSSGVSDLAITTAQDNSPARLLCSTSAQGNTRGSLSTPVEF